MLSKPIGYISYMIILEVTLLTTHIKTNKPKGSHYLDFCIYRESERERDRW